MPKPTPPSVGVGPPAAAWADSLESVLVPALLASRPRPPAADQRDAQTLAQLLLKADVGEALTFIDRLCGGSVRRAGRCAALFEPTARLLGDLWRRDECAEIDVSLGLFHMQAALRRLCAGVLPAMLPAGTAPAVLVVPQPGEAHSLAAALDSEQLFAAGWGIHSAYPRSDKEVQALVRNDWFDAMDLSLSDAFRREDWLPRIACTIDGVRRASLNPAIVVVVGGRLFQDRELAPSVGANGSSHTALDVEHAITRSLLRLRSEDCPARFLS